MTQNPLLVTLCIVKQLRMVVGIKHRLVDHISVWFGAKYWLRENSLITPRDPTLISGYSSSTFPHTNYHNFDFTKLRHAAHTLLDIAVYGFTVYFGTGVERGMLNGWRILSNNISFSLLIPSFHTPANIKISMINQITTICMIR